MGSGTRRGYRRRSRVAVSSTTGGREISNRLRKEHGDVQGWLSATLGDDEKHGWTSGSLIGCGWDYTS
ncbi:hypothetical protein SAMN05421837_102933 [Amycolatopsis pretoriensis]|uniref:Uncharacterized protein n=1 Tax=Amycolatopsis pretoriensis TaxID=218821 RepID=A0A1H5QFN3_9PSEU|nr:hypothetical protein SAMN05421837_102933 [Amycolatopsis pretoriensis]